MASRMRPFVASFLIVFAIGCRCGTSDPKSITLRVKNTSSAPIFVDDSNDILGLEVQRGIAGAWLGFEDTVPCACRTCDQVCDSTCSCGDGGPTSFVRKIQPGDTFERTWNGVVHVTSISTCDVACLAPENAPTDEAFKLQLCYQSEVLGVELPDGGRLAAAYPKPDQTCVDKEFRIADGIVEVSPKKGTTCTQQSDCVGVGELCLAGSCTASCPANGFPVLGAGYALRIDSTDQGFFTTATADAGVAVSTGTGEITSVIYNGGTMTVRLKRTGPSGETLTAAVFVTLPMGQAAPVPQSAKVTVKLIDGSTSTNPENRALTIREATGALLFAADHAQQGMLLKVDDTAPFTVTSTTPIIGCRFNECGKQLFFKTKFSNAPVESSLEPGKAALLTVPQGAFRALNVTDTSFGTTTCKLFDIRPFAIWREKAP